MSLDRRLLAFIATRYPAAWDLIPHGPLWAALNPQPLPPGEKVALNPQPLPPRVLGSRVAENLLHLSWLADRLGSEVSPISDWEDDPCPTWPKVPQLPPHIGPVPEPEPGPDWLRDYHLGLASTLAAAQGRLADSRLVLDALERSGEALSAGLDAGVA